MVEFDFDEGVCIIKLGFDEGVGAIAFSTRNQEEMWDLYSFFFFFFTDSWGIFKILKSRYFKFFEIVCQRKTGNMEIE